MRATPKLRSPMRTVSLTIVFAIAVSLALLLFASAASAGTRWTVNDVPGMGNTDFSTAVHSSMPVIA